MSSLEGPPTNGDWRPLENPGDALVKEIAKWAVQEYNNRGRHLTFNSMLQVWIKVTLGNLKLRDSPLSLT
uniref:Uncharacterized protein n=1 Tax=Cucumis melo TaxID=3656 RepID=A0A9I9E5V0_CUCME